MKRITITNIHKATRREVFEFIKNHLLTQERQSKLDGVCVYKSPQGLKCAAGCLIPDYKYRKSMEGNRYTTLVKKYNIPPAHVKLVDEFQLLHDFAPVTSWRSRINTLEKQFITDGLI